MKMRTQFLPVVLRRAAVIAGALSFSACADVGPQLVSAETEEPPGTTQPKEPATATIDVTARRAQIDANLAQLASLEIFEVGQLLTDTDRTGGNCYGFACPDQREATEIRLAADLNRLVGLSHDLAPATSACSARTVDAKTASHLAVLDSLNIIDIGAFLKAEPANNPMCYNLPCAEDTAAAEATSCEKAALLETLAERAAAEFQVAPPPVFGALDAATEAQTSNDLMMLARLDIFEVGAMVISPAHGNCYVCPEPDAVLANTAAQLSQLAATATTLLEGYRDVEPTTFAGCDPQEGTTALAALAALHVVEVGALIERDAAGEGLCYRGGCTEEQEATAKAMTCRRANAAERLVVAVTAR